MVLKRGFSLLFSLAMPGLLVAGLLGLVISCSLPVANDSGTAAADVEFRDRQGLFEARIPAGASSHVFEGKDYTFYVFEWTGGDQLLVRLEFRVLGSGFGSLTDADYEGRFQKECACAISQKGWALVAGQKAREFQFSVDDRISIERHFQWKDRMIEMQVLGTVSHQDLMRQRLQAVQQSLHLL